MHLPTFPRAMPVTRRVQTDFRGYDGPFGIADVTIENILCGRDHTVINENIRRIQAMTPADVQLLARKYLSREELVTVIAGDLRK